MKDSLYKGTNLGLSRMSQRNLNHDLMVKRTGSNQLVRRKISAKGHDFFDLESACSSVLPWSRQLLHAWPSFMIIRSYEVSCSLRTSTWVASLHIVFHELSTWLFARQDWCQSLPAEPRGISYNTPAYGVCLPWESYRESSLSQNGTCVGKNGGTWL